MLTTLQKRTLLQSSGTLYIYNKTRHSYIYIYIYIYVAYCRPNGWTKWAEIFCGCNRLKNSKFFSKIFSFLKKLPRATPDPSASIYYAWSHGVLLTVYAVHSFYSVLLALHVMYAVHFFYSVLLALHVMYAVHSFYSVLLALHVMYDHFCSYFSLCSLESQLIIHKNSLINSNTHSYCILYINLAK